MKIARPSFALTLLLTCLLGFTSCASNKAIEPAPAATELHSEPMNTPPSQTVATNPSQADQSFGKTLALTQNQNPSFSTPRGLTASTTPFQAFLLNENTWSWLLLLLALLFIWAAIRQLRARRSKKFLAKKEMDWDHHEVLVQTAGIPEDIKLVVKPNTPFKEIIASAAHQGRFAEKGSFIFTENEKTPLDPEHLFDPSHPRHRVLHVHPQKEIIVSAYFNEQVQKMHFSPATTVKKVTAWADYRYKELHPDSSGVYLAIHGYFAPLIPTAHIGRYVPHSQKHLEVDVMTYAKV
jgi:hypothetical protein